MKRRRKLGGNIVATQTCHIILLKTAVRRHKTLLNGEWAGPGLSMSNGDGVQWIRVAGGA